MSKSSTVRCIHCGQLVRQFKLDSGKVVTCELDPVPYRQDMREKGKDRLVTDEGHLIYCEIMSSDYEAQMLTPPHGYAYMLHYLNCRGYEDWRREE